MAINDDNIAYGKVEIVVQSPDLPEIKEGEEIPLASPCIIKDKNTNELLFKWGLE